MIRRVYVARWVLPIASPPIAHGAVAVEGERIVWVGPAASAPEGVRADLGDAALLPGFVNAHTHLELTVMRGFLEDPSFRGWIRRLTTARQAVLTPAWHAASARAGIAEGLLAGITAYGDVSDAGCSMEAMRTLGVRGVMFQEVFGPDPGQCEASMRGLAFRVTALRGGESPLVRLGVSPHAPYTVSDALFRAVAKLAAAQQLPLAVHIAESAAESGLVCAGTGEFADAWRARGIAVAPRARSPIALLYDTGVLGLQPLLVHAVRADAQDLEMVADSGSPVVHCPASNAKLGHGIAPVTEMRTRGIVVALGSDSVASSNRMDLLDEGRLAALLQRVRGPDPAALSARDVLEMATLGGARSLGIDREVGTLEVGKAADMVAFGLDGLRDAPVYAPEEALVFGAAGRPARLVLVAGQTLVAAGALMHDVRADLAAVVEAAQALQTWSRDAESVAPAVHA